MDRLENGAFADGPVFITKAAKHYCINIQEKIYQWNEPTISTAQIRQLGGLRLCCQWTELPSRRIIEAVTHDNNVGWRRLTGESKYLHRCQSKENPRISSLDL